MKEEIHVCPKTLTYMSEQHVYLASVILVCVKKCTLNRVNYLVLSCFLFSPAQNVKQEMVS